MPKCVNHPSDVTSELLDPLPALVRVLAEHEVRPERLAVQLGVREQLVHLVGRIRRRENVEHSGHDERGLRNFWQEAVGGVAVEGGGVLEVVPRVSRAAEEL